MPRHLLWTLAITSIAVFMVTLDNLVVSTALPVLRVDLDASLEELEWTVNAFTLGFAAFLLTGAALGDRFGRRRMLMIGVSLFTAASAGAALAGDMDVLIAARALQGLAAALVMPLTLTILSHAFPPERRGAAIGLWGAVGGVAVASGPLVGGLVIEGISWQWIFWLNVPIGLLLVPLAFRHLDESHGPDRSVDVPGLVLAGGGLLGVVWGIVHGNGQGWGSTGVVGSLTAGVVALAVFVAWELRTPEPMLPMRFFRSRAFSAANAAGLLMSFGMFGAIFLLTQFFQTVQGLSPLDAGLRLLPWTLMPMVVAPLAGAWSDRIGGRPLMAAGLALQAIGLAWQGLVTEPAVSYGSLVLPFVISGAGMGLFFAPVANVVLGSVRAAEAGKASGANATIREVGGALGVAVLAAVFAATGGYESGDAYVDGMRSGVLVGAAVVGLGAVVTLLIPGRRPRRRRRISLAGLAGGVFRLRRGVVALWVALLVGGSFAAGAVGGDWSADYATPGSESKAAGDRIAQRFGGTSPSSIDVVWTAPDARAPRVLQRVDRVLAEAERLDGIGAAPAARAAQVSADGRIGLVRLPLAERNPEDVPTESAERLIALAGDASSAGMRLELGGMVIARGQEQEVSAEAVGFAVAALVLLLTFGTLVASGMPLAVALFGLGVSSSAIALLAAVLDVPDWGASVAAMIGIGVGIDYALLIVTRYRSALADGAAVPGAIAEAMATAGRSVLVAGTTVIIALLGLFLVGLTYLHGVALSAVLAVAVVMAASVTLLPALLGMLGRRVERLPVRRRRPAGESRSARRWGRLVQRRPVALLLAGVAVLLALAAPALDLRLNYPDAGNDRAGTTTRAAYDLVARGFGPGAAGPLLIVADHPGGRRLEALAAAVGREPGVQSVAPPLVNRSRDTAVLAVTPSSGPQTVATERLLERLREQVVPASGVRAEIGGTTASLVDQSQVIADRLPLFIGGVVTLSLLLLVLAFRAPVVAVKAALLNLLSIGAAFGVVAAAADGGWFGDLLGIHEPTPVPPFVPVMMFAILFGLSMDYEVFLLSRIREAFTAGRGAGEAVLEGLVRTARVITAAAAIMVAVFGAFVLSADVNLKFIGIGLASAILIDATVVRMVLVPAVMQLLGARTWWTPRWLRGDRLRLGLEPGAEGARA